MLRFFRKRWRWWRNISLILIMTLMNFAGKSGWAEASCIANLKGWPLSLHLNSYVPWDWNGQHQCWAKATSRSKKCLTGQASDHQPTLQNALKSSLEKRPRNFLKADRRIKLNISTLPNHIFNRTDNLVRIPWNICYRKWYHFYSQTYVMKFGTKDDCSLISFA